VRQAQDDTGGCSRNPKGKPPKRFGSRGKNQCKRLDVTTYYKIGENRIFICRFEREACADFGV
ncbi:MAG: hypothetical protein IKA44_06750, partial [Clostridia bacterium]|nr:hypothetical protein [Clostridia bacterium]